MAPQTTGTGITVVDAFPPSRNSSESTRRKHDSDSDDISGLKTEINELETSDNEKAQLESVESNDITTPECTSPPQITRQMRVRARVYFAACCYCLFLAGWNDGTTGPLLPRIQSNYNVNYAIVSLLFIMNCIGFISGAAINVYLTERFGFGKTLVIGSISQTIAYAIQSPAPPFPVLCLGYVINGFGIALQDAQANGYVASLTDNAAAKMGMLHAAYGSGAFVAPLVATQFSHATHWSFHYLVSLSIAFSNTVVLLLVFRGRDQDACLQAIGQTPSPSPSPKPEIDISLSLQPADTYTTTQTRSSTTNTGSKYRQIMGQKIVHVLMLWALIYVGVEVTVGGWTVTYIIRERNGGSSSGDVSAGFFGGLTLGRVALLWVNAKVGERLVVIIYALLCIGLEIIIWVVPSLIGDAISVAIVGFFLGPMYPILMNQSATLIPPAILTGSIGWIAGCGQAGSALLPFVTGALAQRFGIGSLEPFLVVLMSLMASSWALICWMNRPRKT